MGEVEIQMSQLLNLAIGTPEIGAVNFNLLQRFLSEIMKISDIEDVPVLVTTEELSKLSQQEVTPQTSAEETKDIDQQPSEATKSVESGKRSVVSQSEKRSFVAETERRRSWGIDPSKIDQMLEDMTQLKLDVDELSEKLAQITAATETVPFQEVQTSFRQIDANDIQEKLKMIEGMMENVKDLSTAEGDGRSLGQRLQYLEAQVDTHSDTLTRVNNFLDEQLKPILEKFAYMEQGLGELHERMNLTTTITGRDRSTNGQRLSMSVVQEQSANINSLISRLSSVQQDLDNLTAITTQLTDQHENRQMAIDVLTEQIEVLKLVKADKTNVDDILAVKADLSQVHRKVSHDHFATKLDELYTQLNDAFNRLEAHEEQWQDEVEDLKNDIDNKLDKGEFSPLKEYVNDKLNHLQDKMKTIASRKREGTAAGSKRKIITDVQCISCDNEAVMNTDNTMEEMMPMPALPTQQSAKPYLSYKLDQVRRQQKKLPTGRNLLHYEEMLKEASHPQKSKSRITSGEHLVNRYVGGSHTITTPLQRLTRQGNFYEMWGPVISAVNTPTTQPAQKAYV